MTFQSLNKGEDALPLEILHNPEEVAKIVEVEEKETG